LPAEYGGMGLDQISYGLIMQEIERCDSGLRSLCSVQGSLVMYPIWKYGSEEQKKKWLPDMAAGQEDRLLRPHRARPRQQPRRHGHHLQGQGRPLPAERRQDVDQQRPSPTSPWCGPRPRTPKAASTA
jgi:hypothetical protein